MNYILFHDTHFVTFCHVVQAIDYYRKSMEVQEKLQNPLELADSMNNLGVMLMKRGDYQRAADLCSRALKVPVYLVTACVKLRHD